MGATKKSNLSHSPYRIRFNVRYHIFQFTKPMFTGAEVLTIFNVIHTLNRLDPMDLLQKIEFHSLSKTTFLWF